jgi:amino acid transporter
MTVTATWVAGYHNLAGFLNGCLIFSVLSSSNTALYIASRTLYGMTREIPRTNFLGRQLNNLSIVVPKTGVPAAALLVSAVSFFWLPFVQLKGGYAVQDVHDTSDIPNTRTI